MSNTVKIERVELFGGCAGQDWRKPFIDLLSAGGVEYFDPRKTYTPGDSSHYRSELYGLFAAQNSLRVFGIPDDTACLEALGELDSLLLRDGDRHEIVAYIAPAVNSKVEPQMALLSNHYRVMTKSRIDQFKDSPRIHPAESLEQALRITANFIID